jgi:hypothetical protein
MLEKIEKLIKGNDPENIKLAIGILSNKINETNIIAVISLARLRCVEILEDLTLTDKMSLILKDCDVRFKKKIDSDDINSYKPKDLYELSLNLMQSKDNINYATEYYINYINNLSEDTLQLLLDDECYKV